MSRQIFFFVVISLIQYYVFSVLIQEHWNCVALYRCPELLTVFKNEERLISLKDFLAEYSCSGSIFPPKKVYCENPQLEIQIKSFTSFQDVALQSVNVSISPASKDLWPLCDCGYSPKFRSLSSRNNTAEEGMFPWMVQIYYTEYECEDSCDSITELGNITLCGGSIITKRHVLTAAHCVLTETRLARELKVVLLGTVKKGDKIYEKKVLMVYAHPKYNPETLRNDVAILYLEEDIEMSDSVRPVCLLHSDTIYYNTRLLSAGWGLTKYGNFSDDLLYIDDQVVWNRDVCNIVYKNLITEEMFCTKGLSGSSVCEGDSGGPLVGISKPHPSCSQNSDPVWVALGVTSFGNKTCDAQKPVVFANVVHFLPWIKDTVERARLTHRKTAELFSHFKPKND